MPTARLTDQAVRLLPTPETGTTFYSDDKDRRLQLAIGKRKRTWYSTSTVDGRFIRKPLGEWPHVNAQEARRLHSGFIGDVSKGEDPRDRKAGTLRFWLDTYIAQKTARGKLNTTTAKQYRYAVETYAAKHLDRDLKAITRTDMLRLHEGLKATPYNANLVIRVLKAVFRYADKHEDIADPTKVVEFYKESRRTSNVGDLAEWYAAVSAIANPYRRAFLLTAICTGVRRRNLEGLRWDDLDLAAGTIHLRLTKAGRSITLPVAAQIVVGLHALPRLNEFVFFSSHAKSGHIVEPKGDAPGRIHDLRREFSTACTSVGIPYAHQKLLLDHTISDMTGRYIEESKVDLRASVQSVVDHLHTKMIPADVERLNAA
jgi:integrase